VLSEQLEKFKSSGRTLSSSEVVETYLEVKDRLTLAWQNSLSADGDGREELYRQIKGLEAVMNQLISEWS